MVFVPVFNLNYRRNGTQHFSWKWDYIITDFIVRKFLSTLIFRSYVLLCTLSHFSPKQSYSSIHTFDSIHLISCLFQEDKFPFWIKYEFLEIPFCCLSSNIVNSIILRKFLLYEGEDSWSCLRKNIYFSNCKALLPMNTISLLLLHQGTLWHYCLWILFFNFYPELYIFVFYKFLLGLSSHYFFIFLIFPSLFN